MLKKQKNLLKIKQKNKLKKGFNEASDASLKAVYLALTHRNEKICECDGMNPVGLNEISTSDIYNCSIYESP